MATTNRKRYHAPQRRHYVRSFIVALAIIAIALSVGVCGYHFLNEEAWIDALVDASMILGGMGPVSTLQGDGAKLFASFYALTSGLVFISTAAVLLAPWVRLLLHRFHTDTPPD